MQKLFAIFVLIGAINAAHIRDTQSGSITESPVEVSSQGSFTELPIEVSSESSFTEIPADVSSVSPNGHGVNNRCLVGTLRSDYCHDLESVVCHMNATDVLKVVNHCVDDNSSTEDDNSSIEDDNSSEEDDKSSEEDNSTEEDNASTEDASTKTVDIRCLVKYLEMGPLDHQLDQSVVLDYVQSCVDDTPVTEVSVEVSSQDSFTELPIEVSSESSFFTIIQDNDVTSEKPKN